MSAWSLLGDERLDSQGPQTILSTPTSWLLPPGSSGRITRRPDNSILKSGSRVRREEGEALKLAYSLQLPVPRVRAVSSLPEDGMGILMDAVNGECLEDEWPGLSSEQKKSVAQQLRQIVSTMRSASSTTVGQ